MQYLEFGFGIDIFEVFSVFRCSLVNVLPQHLNRQLGIFYPKKGRKKNK